MIFTPDSSKPYREPTAPTLHDLLRARARISPEAAAIRAPGRGALSVRLPPEPGSGDGSGTTRLRFEAERPRRGRPAERPGNGGRVRCHRVGDHMRAAQSCVSPQRVRLLSVGPQREGARHLVRDGVAGAGDRHRTWHTDHRADDRAQRSRRRLPSERAAPTDGGFRRRARAERGHGARSSHVGDDVAAENRPAVARQPVRLGSSHLGDARLERPGSLPQRHAAFSHPRADGCGRCVAEHRRQRVVHAGLDPERFFQWIDVERPTWYTAVPTMHQAILSRAAANGDDHLAPAACGSSVPLRHRSRRRC